MAYGLKVWDASGVVKVDTSLQAARFIAYGSSTFGTSSPYTSSSITDSNITASAGDGELLILISYAQAGPAPAQVTVTGTGGTAFTTTPGSASDSGKTFYWWAYRTI